MTTMRAALADLQQMITDYQDVPDPSDEDGQAVIQRAREALAALAAREGAEPIDSHEILKQDYAPSPAPAGLTRDAVALAACGSGILCRDPIDGRMAGSCHLCGDVADRIFALLPAPGGESGWTAGAAAMRKVVIVCVKSHRDRANHCECLGPMDWETGVSECSVEVRGGDCLCADRIEEADRIIAKLEALPLPPAPTEERT